MATLKIIYSCYYGCYLSVAAAYLHLGVLKREGNRSCDVAGLQGFGEIDGEKLGELTCRGEDKEGRRIYTIASKGSAKIVKRVLTGFSEVYGIGPFEFIDMNKYTNVYISLGIFVSRKLSGKLGNEIISWGLTRVFVKLAKDVNYIDY